MNTFKGYIKELRGSMSLREAAIKTGISHGYIDQLEKGMKKVPSIEIIEKIAFGYNKPFLEVYKVFINEQIELIKELRGE